MRRLLALAIALVVACWLAVAPALASTVRATTGESGIYGVSAGTVYYDAAPGEANRMRATLVAGSHGVVDLRDDGAVITAGDRCTAVGPHEVRCDTAADFVNVTADGNDLDDELTVDVPLYGLVLGGDGNDVLGGCQLTGGPGNDVLHGCVGIQYGSGLNHNLLGGAGDDVIEGGDSADVIQGDGGHDVLSGGDGNDSINDNDGAVGEAGGDVVDGGPGSDTVWYADRTGPVHVDLADPAARQGTARDGDTLVSVENVYGGSAADTLLGNADPNRLDGGRGNDTIDGRAGSDLLLGGAGVDVIRAGAGHDQVVTRDLYKDTIGCGSGTDGGIADRGDKVARDCESVAPTAVDLIPARMRIGVKKRVAGIRLACPDQDELPRTVAREFDPCNIRVVLKLPVAGHLVVAGTTYCRVWLCDPMTLRPAAWRMLLHRRQVTGRAEFVRSPRTGTLPHAERVTVKVSR